MTARPPEQVMAATLRQLGPCDPDVAAQRQIADLAGHGWDLVQRPAAPVCGLHPNTAPVGGHCPTCGPRED